MKTTHQKAIDLHKALENINIDNINIIDLARSAPRKEQATAARHLFKSLGLKGISVTCPNHSFATAVDLDIPGLAEKLTNNAYHVHFKNNMAQRKITSIIEKAFPNHLDKSTEDFCWLIRTI